MKQRSDNKISADAKARRRAIKIISASLAVILILSALGFIVVYSLTTDKNGFDALINAGTMHPYISAVVLAIVNIVQVIIAFIPGEVVEQACGLILGPVWGPLLCLAGTMAGSCLVLLLVKKFGRDLVYAIYPKEKIDSISFLHDKKKRDALTFALFFIPGTPKDALTYAIGLTDMSIPKYVALTGIARLPSIIMSTVSGNWISEALSGHGKLFELIVLNGASLVICAVGYIIYMWISKKHTQHKEKSKK